MEHIKILIVKVALVELLVHCRASHLDKKIILALQIAWVFQMRHAWNHLEKERCARINCTD